MESENNADLNQSNFNEALAKLTVQLSDFTPQDGETLAVLPFEALEGGTVLQSYVQTLLSQAFFNFETVRRVERDALELIMTEQDFNLSGYVDEASAQNIGYLAGADYICFGDITILPQKIWITGKTVDVLTGEIVSIGSIMANRDDLVNQLIAQGSTAVDEGIQLQLPHEQDAPQGIMISSADSDGKEAERTYDRIFVRHNGVLEKYNGSEEVVEIPPDVHTIGRQAFMKSTVKRVIFHENLREIQDEAFMFSSLEEIELPESIEYLGKNAFKQCLRLESVVMNASITKLPDDLFSICDSLKEVQLNSPIREIGKSFNSCIGLDSITIPASVEKIEDFAFSGCKNLNKVVFLGKIPVVGPKTFYGTPWELQQKNTLSTSRW